MFRNHRTAALALCAVLAVMLTFSSPVPAAISWDAGAGTQWWFDPVNWNTNTQTNMVLPPNQGDNTAIDAQINIGTGSLPGGEGVVYDPANDPNFAAASSLPYPTGSTLATLPGIMRDYGPETIYRLYVSRNVTNTNLLTIKSGDLVIESTTIIGRSGSSVGAQNLGRVNQLGGTVRLPLIALDMGQREASGWGNGTWDYRGGNLEVSAQGGSGIRLSAGGSSGPGGVGTFIMRNPTTSGHVRAYDFNVAANAGQTGNLPDGINTGVGIVEFHFQNGGTRPIQVNRNLIINNGSTDTGAVRSARLGLVLDAPPSVNGSGVPQDLGLFDVAFSDSSGTSTTGAGSLGDFFSSADSSTLYSEGATVSAMFAGSTYNWTITYAGNITWADADAGSVASISDTGGVDVVLKGLSSVIVPAGVPGDYNANGTVDAADYVLWRKGGPLQNEVDMPGTVNAADYSEWRARFGNTSGAGSNLNAAGIPEPGAAMLLFAVVIGLLARRQV
jgi:hypothetical protein